MVLYHNVNDGNIQLNNNFIPRCDNVIPTNDIEKHCKTLNNNVILPYNIENQCQKLNSMVVFNRNQ